MDSAKCRVSSFYVKPKVNFESQPDQPSRFWEGSWRDEIPAKTLCFDGDFHRSPLLPYIWLSACHFR